MAQRVNWTHLPVSMPNGNLLPHMSARARTEVIDIVFQDIGGPAAMSDWARQNQTEFYQMWGRGAVRSTNVELSADSSMESLLDRLDAGEHAKVISPDGE